MRHSSATAQAVTGTPFTPEQRATVHNMIRDSLSPLTNFRVTSGGWVSADRLDGRKVYSEGTV